MHDKHDGDCQTFMGVAHIGLQVFCRLWTLHTCVKTTGAVNAARDCSISVVQNTKHSAIFFVAFCIFLAAASEGHFDMILHA